MNHPALPLTGRVLSPSGEPVVGTQIVVAVKGRIQLERGWPTNAGEHAQARTDSEGGFVVPIEVEPGAPFTIFAVHESGTAIMTSEDYRPGSVVELSPWLSVRGEARSEGEPSAHTNLLMRAGHYPSVEFPSRWDPAPMVSNSAEIQTDREGRFVFDHIPARMEGDVHRTDPDGSWGFCAHFSSPKEHVGPIEPEFLRIDGCTIVGRVELPEVKEPVVTAILKAVRRGFEKPPGYDQMPPQTQFEIYQAWCDSDDGRRAQSRLSYAMIKFDARGQFCVRDVPPGTELRLHASVYRNHDSAWDNLIHWFKREPREVEISHTFTLPEGSEHYDVGTIE